ncbi:MAG: hypothetical protein IPK52_12750 [Chloroflexi bacterium]|nr:hypothetical protein [Chloroflexota bacterium]
MAGAERHFALATGDLDVLWEGIPEAPVRKHSYNEGVLTFIDPNVGGSGYLEKMAESSIALPPLPLAIWIMATGKVLCSRCLKSYSNQRFHDRLPLADIMSTLRG